MAWYRPGEPSFRMKVKAAEYVRLHRIITGVSTKTIWEMLSSGKDFGELLELVPDEFYDWVRSVETQLRGKFAEIFNEIELEYQRICHLSDDRKAFAKEALRHPYSSFLFARLDNKPLDIWKLIKPAFARPFRAEV